MNSNALHLILLENLAKYVMMCRPGKGDKIMSTLNNRLYLMSWEGLSGYQNLETYVEERILK